MTSTAPRTRTKPRVRSAVAAAAALALAGALPPAALAAPVRPVEVSATIVLRSPSQPATAALAATTGLSRTERLARLRATMPAAGVEAAALSSTARLGLTVDHTTPWTVVVHGPAAAVAALVASGSALGASVAASPSLVPAAQTVVSGGPAKHFRPHALRALQGVDFRGAYGASSAVPTGATAPVIATIQLAGWDSSELATYAALPTVALPAPPAGTFTPVLVDQSKRPAVSADSQEVAIDQEAIYSVDPYAKQRAYFAPNDKAGLGYLDALYAVAEDALTSSSIVTLSTSWGLCEALTGADYMNATHLALQQLLAAGVTTFAPSGDAGSNDCLPSAVNTKDVDYPASDPLVVAVGGTKLDPSGPVETAWANHDTPDGSLQGSGGGQSTGWPRPAYQAGVAPAATGRQVPDIAADASDQSPFPIWFDGAADVGFGTSLAAPVSAALLTAELGSRGLTNGGVGDIHNALYSAPATSFRDVTVGSNGAYSAAVGYDLVTGLGAPNWHAIVDQLVLAPVVHAPAYQTSRTIRPTVTAPGGQVFVAWATGTGPPDACSTDTHRPATPAAVTVPKDGVYTVWVQGYLGYRRCLTGVTTVTVDSAGPAVVLAAKASTPAGKKVKFGWLVSDDLAGVAGVSASVLRNGKQIWAGQSAGSGTVTLKGKLGSSYRLVVVATDKLGNGRTVKRSLGVAYDDKAFTFGAGWARTRSRSAFGGAFVATSRTGSAAHLKAFGSTYVLVARTGPTGGVAAVFVNGKHVRDVSLFSKRAKAQVRIKLASFGSAKVRSVVLVVKGVRASKGVRGSKRRVVTVDALVAT